jgi:saccharopine dehydrogenase (NAD+, L-lysine-forming)
MAKVVVLGGSGAVGNVAVRTLAETDGFDEVVIADRDLDAAGRLASELGAGATPMAVDASDRASIAAAVVGADVVLNCVGPFHLTVETVLDAVLDAGVDYVDVCDDVDVTLNILDWDERARNAGVRALIGMGASPGATNLIAKLVSQQFLDVTDSIDIFHTHGGEPHEGPGVVGHRFHCMSIPIPMYLDGELTDVDYFGEDGMALRQTFDFPRIGDAIPLFPYPHPEQVTLPRTIDCRQVTNKGSVLPIEYYELTAEACRLGLNSRDAVDVNGVEVVPADFAIAWLIRERDRLLAESDFGTQKGCMSVVVVGTQGGARNEYRVHMTSTSHGLGEGTGIPAAIGALLMLEGRVDGPGVLPPEAAVEPEDFLDRWRSIQDVGEESGAAVLVEHIDPEGVIHDLDW